VRLDGRNWSRRHLILRPRNGLSIGRNEDNGSQKRKFGDGDEKWCFESNDGGPSRCGNQKTQPERNGRRHQSLERTAGPGRIPCVAGAHKLRGRPKYNAKCDSPAPRLRLRRGMAFEAAPRTYTITIGRTGAPVAPRIFVASKMKHAA
jgi:hypothetical protein